MQIVINITEEDYEKIRETSFVENIEIVFKQSSEDRKGTMMLFRVIDAIKNGTLLPKGHGRLIDADKIGLTNFECFMCGGDYKEGLKMLIHKIETAPTIIEADRESEVEE